MHGVRKEMISKTFRKPHQVPLMPEGVDDELRNHLIKKWCTGASCVCVFENGLDLRSADRPNLTCATTLPLYGKGLC